MQDSRAGTDYWQLFRSVQPLFAAELPWHTQDDSSVPSSTELSPEVVGSLIKLCIQEASVHVQMETFDSMTTGNFASLILEDLRDFLYRLDLVVRDIVFNHIDEAAVKYFDEKVRRLVAIGHILQTSSSGSTDFGEFTKFLFLDQDPKDLQRIMVDIVKLNKKLVVATSNNRPNIVVPAASRTRGTTAVDESISWLQTSSNPMFWSSSQKLWETLMEKLKLCGIPAHSTMLSLKGLKSSRLNDERIEFDMLFQPCSTKDSWQAVLCSILSKEPTESELDDTQSLENICEAVELANVHRDMLDIRVHDEKCWCQVGDERQITYPEALPTMRISQLLDSGVLGDTWKFDPLDKWILALNLAESLLQFHGGPWLQTLWTSENLFLLYEADHGRKLRNIRNPFVTCKFSDNPPSLPSPNLFDSHPLLLTFGQFLLELAGGKRLPVQTTRQGEISLYRTLKENFKEFHMVSTSEHYKKAIEGCLDFRKLQRQEKDSEEDVRIRSAIYKNIVQPLKQHLRAYVEYMRSGKMSASTAKRQELSFDNSDPKDLDLGEKFHLPTPHGAPAKIVSASAALASRSSTAVGVPRSEHVGDRDQSNRSASSVVTRVSQPRLNLNRMKTSSTKANTHVISPQNETKVPIDRESDVECSTSESDPGFGFTTEVVGANGSLLGSFDTKHSSEESPESPEWGTTFQKLSQTYTLCFQHMLSDRPVKVAILDTGIDLTHPDFQNRRSDLRKGSLKPVKHKTENKQIDRVVQQHNFCKDLDYQDVTDLDGHGTHVAGIILQLAPTAQLYIARVCRGDDGGIQKLPAAQTELSGKDSKRSADLVGIDPENAEKAIRWAIEQRVDLINMSFGFRNSIKAVDQALRDAKEVGIVIVAASANSGNHTKIAWPARDPERALCVHSSNDYGTVKSEFMPKPDKKTTNFMVVGEKVCSHRPKTRGGGFQRLSGASMATPVATAIAALILAFIRQGVVCEKTKTDVEDEIGEVGVEDNEALPRMRTLLKHICNEDPKHLYWLQPELFWCGFDVARAQAKDPSAVSRHAWEKIREALQK